MNIKVTMMLGATICALLAGTSAASAQYPYPYGGYPYGYRMPPAVIYIPPIPMYYPPPRYVYPRYYNPYPMSPLCYAAPVFDFTGRRVIGSQTVCP